MQELAALIEEKFIQRRDVKAKQASNGEYHPVRKSADPASYVPWAQQDITDHLNGSHTYGHYLISRDDECKLFAFDIDFEQTGLIPVDCPTDAWPSGFEQGNPREIWRQRNHLARPWLKKQLRIISGILAEGIFNVGFPVAVAYSGHKGLHVYALTGTSDVRDARDGALAVLKESGKFELYRGKNFYRHVDQSEKGYSTLSIEVYPKQDSIKTQELGNLMRLPLGRNLRSNDPTFFVDLNAPIVELRPVDPIYALTTANPWVGEG